MSRRSGGKRLYQLKYLVRNLFNIPISLTASFYSFFIYVVFDTMYDPSKSHQKKKKVLQRHAYNLACCGVCTKSCGYLHRKAFSRRSCEESQ